MKKLIIIICLTFFIPVAHAGWNPKKKKNVVTKEQKQKVEETIAAFKEKDPEIDVFFEEARGYSVFPSIGKGGIGIGGAHGKGVVYDRGKLIGTSKMTQLSIGLQLGAQSYSEIIFFKDKKALEDFTGGKFKFGAHVSAVALEAGASATAAYNDGVAIFTMIRGGLMYEASVGGQKFSYAPLHK